MSSFVNGLTIELGELLTFIFHWHFLDSPYGTIKYRREVKVMHNYRRIAYSVSLVLLMAMLLFTKPPYALADFSYAYTGTAFNTFQTFSGPTGSAEGYWNSDNAISGILTVESILNNPTGSYVTPKSFSFTDGNTTWTNTTVSNLNIGTPPTSYIMLTTTNDGEITAWSLRLRQPDPTEAGTAQMSSIYSGTYHDDRSDLNVGSLSIRALNDDQQGSWSLPSPTSPVPIPGTIWLLGSGVVGLLGIRRRLSN
jgi:hypothetical protein